MGAHPGQKAQGEVQGTQGVPFKLASGTWNLDNLEWHVPFWALCFKRDIDQVGIIIATTVIDPC